MELVPLSPELDASIPLLSAIDDIRKPISPRAVIAKPTIDAGYIERGLLATPGAEKAWRLVVPEGSGRDVDEVGLPAADDALVKAGIGVVSFKRS